MEVALWGLVWFGGMVLAVNEFRRSADSLVAPPDVVSRLARRVSSGLGVFLVGLAAVAAFACVPYVAQWAGMDASSGRAAALFRLMANALVAAAPLGVVLWAFVFDLIVWMMTRCLGDPEN